MEEAKSLDQPLDQDCAVEHEHSYKKFDLPGEPPGRVYQCVVCRAIGYRRPRFAGVGKIVNYQCTHPKCTATARSRIPGRGARGAYIWACFEHAPPLIEGIDHSVTVTAK